MVSARATAKRVSLMASTLYQLISGASAEDFDGMKQGMLELAGELDAEAGETVNVLDFIQDHAPTLRIVRAASL